MRVITIPITDDGTVCNNGYIVQYKLASLPDSDFIRIVPDPIISPIVIQNLEDDTEYTVRITRKCCDGSESDYTETDVTTTVNSPL